MMKHRGIKYYGPHDMSSGWHLREVESFFQNWDENTRNLDINTILELYNIKQYLDADMRLKQWTDEKFAGFKNNCKLIPGILGRFCSTITDSNLGTLYDSVDWCYFDDFWSLIADYKVHHHISPEAMRNLMDSDDTIVWHILEHKILVISFGQIIADHLVHNQHTAEELISHYLAAHERTDNQLYFPAEFTQSMRDKALSDFVDREDGNINHLRLLEQAQSTKEFPISDRLRLKARKKGDLLQEKLFADSTGMSYGSEVMFKSIPDGSIEESYKDHVLCSAYSREWIEENQDYPTLLNNFIYLFGYVDRQYRCSFMSLKSDLGVFERNFGIKGKKDYEKGIAFNVKRMHSLLQMTAYQQELLRLNIRLEAIFKWFFEDYLKTEFNAIGFTYSPPSEGTTYAEKCKLLAISIDGILKQYRLFCEDGYVNRELLEISSGHVVFGDLDSMREKKYAYSNSADLQLEQYLLFSDQSMMSYTEKTGSKYHTLPQLLLVEHMTREDFAEYQQRDLDWLITRNAVTVSDDGYLQVNKVRSYVLKDLFINEVICPEYYSSELKRQVEKLAANGDIRYENTLFSKPEQDYINYVLNKAEFSNGLDLRNKYSHDTCSLDENTQMHDYLELLKIMVLIIIKINEEFRTKDAKKNPTPQNSL